MSSILDALRRAQQQAASGSPNPDNPSDDEPKSQQRSQGSPQDSPHARPDASRDALEPSGSSDPQRQWAILPSARSAAPDEEPSRRELDRETEDLARKLAQATTTGKTGEFVFSEPSVRDSAMPEIADEGGGDASDDGGDGGGGGGDGPGTGAPLPPPRRPGLLKIAVVVVLGLGIGAAASRLLLPGASEAPPLGQQVELARKPEQGAGDAPVGEQTPPEVEGARGKVPSIKPSEGGKHKPPLLAPASPKRNAQKREPGPGGDKGDKQARGAAKHAGKGTEPLAAQQAAAPAESASEEAGPTEPPAKLALRDPFASAAKPAGLDAGDEATSEPTGIGAKPEPAGDGAKPEPTGDVPAAPADEQGALAGRVAPSPEATMAPAGKPSSPPVPAKGAVPAPIALGSKPAKPAPPVEPILAPDAPPGADVDAVADSSDQATSDLELASANPPATEVLDKAPPGAPEVILLFIQWSSFPERRVASFRGPGGRLLIVHEGDIVEGMKVMTIGQATVEFQWRGSAFRVYAGRSAPAS